MRDSTAALIKRIVSEYGSIADDSRQDKFRLVKEAITSSLVVSSEHDRFPAIRALSKALGVTQVPIQKAITELIAENRLYSKSRVGVFVRTPTEESSLNTTVEQKRDFALLFDDRSEKIQTMMHPVLRLLRERLDRLEIGLFFHPNSKSRFDVYIQSPLPQDLPCLNLAASVGHEVRRGQLFLTNDFTAPLAHQTYYFAWNRKQFRKAGFPEPCYTSFSEQKEYFREFCNCFELPVLSWLRPDFLLGTRITDIINVLRRDDVPGSAREREIMPMIERILDFCGLWEYERNAAPVNTFLRGKRAGMVLQTTSMFDLEPEINNLELGYYPVLGCDDALILLPTPMQIPAIRDVFYDGVQILKTLQSEEVQQEFFRRNYITVQGKGRHLPEALGDAVKAAHCIVSGNDTESYLRHTVIRYEMLMTGVYGKDCSTAVENIAGYGHSVLANFSSEGRNDER